MSVRRPLYGVGGAASQPARWADPPVSRPASGSRETHNATLCLPQHDVMQWWLDSSTPRAAKEATVQTTTTTDPLAALCADPGAQAPGSVSPSLSAQPLFPPKDADAETRRRWLASSPWPEVVFAAAGA